MDPPNVLRDVGRRLGGPLVRLDQPDHREQTSQEPQPRQRRSVDGEWIAAYDLVDERPPMEGAKRREVQRRVPHNGITPVEDASESAGSPIDEQMLWRQVVVNAAQRPGRAFVVRSAGLTASAGTPEMNR